MKYENGFEKHSIPRDIMAGHGAILVSTFRGGQHAEEDTAFSQRMPEAFKHQDKTK